MELIFQKLLDDARVLLSEFWQAIWHGRRSADRAEPTTTLKSGSSGTNPIV